VNDNLQWGLAQGQIFDFFSILYIEWYGDKLKLPQEISERFEKLNSATDIFCEILEKKVKTLETEFRKEIDKKRLSRDQVIETWRILDKA